MKKSKRYSKKQRHSSSKKHLLKVLQTKSQKVLKEKAQLTLLIRWTSAKYHLIRYQSSQTVFQLP